MDESLSSGMLKDDIVYTLMKVSQSDSTSSSSLDQSTPVSNKIVNYKKLHCTATNSNLRAQMISYEFPMNTTINNKVNLVKELNEKLIQFDWNNYINWKILLSFGLGLWIALCITDGHYRQDISLLKIKESSEIIETTISTNFEEDITIENVNNPHLDKWINKILLYISWINRVPNIPEACILSLFMIIVSLFEFRLRKKSTKNQSQRSCTECNHDCLKAKLSNDRYYCDKLEIEKFKNEKEQNSYDELGQILSLKKCNSPIVKHAPYDELYADSDIFLKLKIVESCDHVTDNIKCNQNKHFNKLTIDSNVTTNIDSISWNNINHNNDQNKKINNNSNNRKLNSPNWNSPLLYCSCNNPIESINVNSTYDTKTEKFIISKLSKCNTSTVALEDMTSELQKIKNNDIGRRKISTANKRNSRNNNYHDDELLLVTPDKNSKNENNGIISSSPAFKKFLRNLQNNPTAFNTRSWIWK